MRITSKGQVTIPVDLRELFGLFPDSEVEMIKSKGGVLIRKKAGVDTRGDKLIRHMKGTAKKIRMTTDEIMELTRGDHD